DARGTSTKAADSGAADARSSDARARSATRRGGALSSESTLADRRPGARLLWPVHGVLISRFGDRHGEHHEGIDLAAPEGTHIVAAAPGTVVFVGEQRGYGQLVLVAHGGDLVTVYAHNEENLVTVGQKVDRGQALARVGRTGNASGPHLHFEVRADAHAVDPLPYLR
ncbi:MAG: M23 family metallopeptidase, partial [Deltaproteobacteria bacterium]|nr:M23 family metallopeptidase [Deltaproteobacteria bacterium]